MSMIPRAAELLEVAIMLFQVVGVCSLGVYRLMPGPRATSWSRIAFIIAVVGLGISGAFCGQHDSEFALFAGVTMTALLMGMTIGSSPVRGEMAGSSMAG